MRAEQIIGNVDRIYPNNIDTDTKIVWLARLDAQVKSEVIDTHVRPEKEETKPKFSKETPEGEKDEEPLTIDDEGYFENYGMSTVLLIPDNYADVYEYYLKMRIAGEYGESDRYSLYQTQYDNAYISYQGYYNRYNLPNHTLVRY